ncbi:Protein of unknown function [Cellulophaga tyrosinoxydans]|uniref:DUF1800 domain-containing protein n=2 Tax=Cellulophaga tyrosinoxydans TaxID=504486 RepID=A0A1W2C4I8_9FLAO|nr:Protein of unknown function [Cellulophaga tyrosinoxydans]
MLMNKRNIQHLYLRGGFGINSNKLKELEDKATKDVVKELFDDSENYIPLKIDLSELRIMVIDDNKKNSEKTAKKEAKMRLQKLNRQKTKELNYAWIDRLKQPRSILKEKMTLFWANVFVCQDNNNIFHLQQYNNTLRKFALGNFKDFVKAIAKEPSMSKYLNNRQNVKESPNENFARELMELFTLGVGNYSERDIKAAARAFTGWSFKFNGDFYLRENKHDFGQKTFFGKTGNFDGEEIIDIILEQKQCARFICTKIYYYFVNPKPNEKHIEELANFFYEDYDIKKLMHYIFSSDWFYNDENIGVKIKSPIELLVGIQTIVPVEFQKKQQLYNLQKLMGQILLNPPNVAGWKGNKSWIDANTLMLRLKLSAILLNNAIIDIEEKGEFEDSFDDYYKIQKKQNNYIKTIVSWNVFESEYGILDLPELKEVLIVAEMDKDTNAFIENLKFSSNKDFCIQLMSIPEYQLC